MQRLFPLRTFLTDPQIRLSSSCSAAAATSGRPLYPDRPIGYISLIHEHVPYDVGLTLQTHLVERRRRYENDGDPPDVIVFLQHTPTYTAGRRIRNNEEEEARLRKLGADYFETMRGGQVTYHGPGQLIAYPILDIRDYQINVRCYVSRLEKTVIDCCAQYGIKANTTENTGVWVGQDHKIAALGVHLQRYVSSHGVALNCNVDLDWYNHIVPCGLADKKVTSISEQLQKTVTPKDVMPVLADSFARLFGVPVSPVSANGTLMQQVNQIVQERRKQ